MASVAADSIKRMHTKEHSWCTVEQLPPREAGLKPGWNVWCSPSEVEIAKLATVTAAYIIFVLGPSQNERARLLDMRPVD